jgi:hypothetical protein
VSGKFKFQKCHAGKYHRTIISLQKCAGLCLVINILAENLNKPWPLEIAWVNLIRLLHFRYILIVLNRNEDS